MAKQVYTNSTPGKKSAVWDYFKTCEHDISMVTCQVCFEEISRGKSSEKLGNFNTSNMIKHLKKHGAEHSEFELKQEKLRASMTRTPAKTPPITSLFSPKPSTKVIPKGSDLDKKITK